MKWKPILDTDNIRKEVPLDKPFISLWKGITCITQFDEEEDHFYISFFPSDYLKTQKVCHEREIKFTHWMEIELPEDY